MSRSPKAQLSPGNEILPAFADTLLGRDDDLTLKWNVPRHEVLLGVQTVGGMAALAKVDRTTVYRAKIAPGSFQALEWVCRRRRHMGRPLVESQSQSDEDSRSRYPRAMYPRFYDALDLIESNRYLPQVRIVVNDPPSAFPVDKLSKPKVRPRKIQNVQAADESRKITSADRKLFADAEKRGLLVKYRKTHLSIKALCGLLKISRMGFWKWRKSLPLELQPRLTSALRG